MTKKRELELLRMKYEMLLARTVEMQCIIAKVPQEQLARIVQAVKAEDGGA